MSARILYVDLAPYPGGSIISLAQLIAGLDKERWEPMVVLSRQNPFSGFAEMGIDVAYVPTPQWERLAKATSGHPSPSTPASHPDPAFKRTALWRFGGEVRRWGRDIFPVVRALRPIVNAFQPHLIHLNDALPLVRHGVLAAKLTRTPVINHSRSFVLPHRLERRWLLPSLQGMIFISKAVARAHLQDVSSPPPSRVIPNPVNLDVFRRSHFHDLRRDLGLPADTPLIAMVGRIAPWKGQHIFIEAFAHLRQHMPDAHALIIGDVGTGRDQQYKEALIARSLEMHLQDHLHWLGHRSDIPSILMNCDLLVHCSVEPEPFGRVIIEGMAAGAPVIGSRAGGVPEIIDHEVNGLLTPPGDIAALAAAMLRLLTDRPLRERVIAHGQRTVRQRYTVEKHVQAVTEFYRELGVS